MAIEPLEHRSAQNRICIGDALPSAKTTWVTAPDGLDARVVGPWVGRKIHHVDRLLDIFSVAMRKKWQRLAYVELFSGPGLSKDKVTGAWVEGSARRAIHRAFTDYVFVDMDPRATSALTARLRADGLASSPKNISVITGNCTDAISSVRRAIPPSSLSLAFVDPTTWQIQFDAIRRLVDGRRVDLLYTFHVGAMRRVGATPARGLDEFFGIADWRAALREPKERRAETLVRLYNEQLEPLGYQRTPMEYAVPVRNSKGVTMYVLVLFSRHPLGVKFWREAMAVNELGQRSLWDPTD